MKQCSKCLQLKTLDNFTDAIQNRDGKCGRCKQCVKDSQTNFNLKLDRMYSSQKSNSKERGHTLPNYTKAEFIEWCLANDYYSIYTKWKENNFDKHLAPSADRLDDSLPYTLHNLQLVTWGFNNSKGNQDTFSGKLSHVHKKVNQYTKQGEFIKTHLSQSIAAREVKSTQSNICAVCCGKRKYAKGYIWKYTDE